MDYIATANERHLIVVALTDMIDLAQGDGSADSRLVAEQANKLLERMEIENLYVPKPR